MLRDLPQELLLRGVQADAARDHIVDGPVALDGQLQWPEDVDADGVDRRLSLRRLQLAVRARHGAPRVVPIPSMMVCSRAPRGPLTLEIRLSDVVAAVCRLSIFERWSRERRRPVDAWPTALRSVHPAASRGRPLSQSRDGQGEQMSLDSPTEPDAQRSDDLRSSRALAVS